MYFDLQRFAIINNSTANSVVSGTSSGDSISNSGRGAVIRAGDGNDTIDNRANYAWLYGDNGNDSINSAKGDSYYSRSATIIGGRGNDTLTGSNGYGDVFLYANGDGNDVITNYEQSDWIRITDGTSYSTQVASSDIVVNVGSGSMRLQNAYGKTLNIFSGNYIANETSGSVVSGSDSRDFIYNGGRGAVIHAGAGNDIVDNRANYAWLYGDDGNDSINSAKGDSYYSRSATLIGGHGDDTLTGSNGYADMFLYANGDGNDVITNYETSDWIRITDGTSYSTQVSGSDIVVNVGSGSIRLKNSYGKTLNIFSGNYIANETANSIVSGTSSRDFIYNGGRNAVIYAGAGNDVIDNRANYAWLYGDAGNDSINSAKGDSYYSRSATITGGLGNDTLTGSNGYADVFQYASGDGNDIITNYETIDSIVLTDNSSYSTLISDADVVVRVRTGSITLKNAVGKNLNIVTSGGYDTTPAVTTPADTTPPDTTPSGARKIVNYTRNTLLSGSSYSDSIQNYAGGVTIRGGAGNDNIYNNTSADYTVRSGYGYVTIEAGAGNDTIRSADPNVSIAGGAGNDYIYTAAYSNLTLNGGTGNDTILASGSYKVIEYASGDGNDIVTGINATDTIRLTDGSSYTTVTSGSDVIMRVGSGSMTLKNGVGKAFKVVGGSYDTPTVPGGGDSTGTTLTLTLALGSTGFTYSIDNDTMTLRDSSGQVTLTINGASNFLRAYANSALPGGDGDWLRALSTATLGGFEASSENEPVEIVGTDLGDKLKAPKNGATLDGGLGNDKLYGSDGADTFIYTGGNDRIYNYGVEDRIVLGTPIDKVKISGKSVKFTTSEGSLTINKAVGQELTVVDAAGEESKYIFTKKNNDLDSARIEPRAQLPTDEYWFEAASEDTSPLSEIITSESAVDLSSEIFSRPHALGNLQLTAPPRGAGDKIIKH